MYSWGVQRWQNHCRDMNRLMAPTTVDRYGSENRSDVTATKQSPADDDEPPTDPSDIRITHGAEQRKDWLFHGLCNPLKAKASVIEEDVALYDWWLEQSAQRKELVTDTNVLLPGKTVVRRRHFLPAFSARDVADGRCEQGGEMERMCLLKKASPRNTLSKPRDH